MSKHTPGPWQIARPNNERCRVDIETVERGVDLITQGNHIAVAYWGTPIEEANARLIAAAPELFAALEGMLEWARRVKGPNPGLEILNACNAIAKAEGKP